MVEILEQPDIRRIVSPMTVETYHQLAELGPDVQSTELIRGIVVEKVDQTSHSQLHIYLIRRLVRMIQAVAQTSGVFTLREDPLTLADSEPEPDIAVIHGREEDYDLVRLSTALLVIEVAVTSLALDRAKAALYAEANVPEYWIVLGPQERIEVYTALIDGLYQFSGLIQQRGFFVSKLFLGTRLLGKLRLPCPLLDQPRELVLYAQQRIYRRGETIQSEALPSLSVELDVLFGG